MVVHETYRGREVLWFVLFFYTNNKKKIKQFFLIHNHHNDAHVSCMLVTCRICLQDDVASAMIHPCMCNGTQKYVHKHCLCKWISISHRPDCPECGYTFVIRHETSVANQRAGVAQRIASGLGSSSACANTAMVIVLAAWCYLSQVFIPLPPWVVLDHHQIVSHATIAYTIPNVGMFAYDANALMLGARAWCVYRGGCSGTVTYFIFLTVFVLTFFLNPLLSGFVLAVQINVVSKRYIHAVTQHSLQLIPLVDRFDVENYARN
jgi:E3 ubiquitin-protein ligase DOA10